MILALTAVLTLLAGCGERSARSRLTVAREALGNGDYAVSHSICQELLDDSLSLTIDELCEVSLIEMKLTESPESEIEPDNAVKGYRRAWRIDPEGARRFFHNRSIDDERYVRMLAALAASVEHRQSFDDDFPIDTVAIDSIL